jgi:hypothetical protein
MDLIIKRRKAKNKFETWLNEKLLSHSGTYIGIIDVNKQPMADGVAKGERLEKIVVTSYLFCALDDEDARRIAKGKGFDAFLRVDAAFIRMGQKPFEKVKI